MTTIDARRRAGSKKKDGIAQLYLRGRLMRWQRETATRFSEVWLLAHSNGLRSPDYSVERVDGGNPSGRIGTSDAIMAARDKLVSAERVLGGHAYCLVTLACVHDWGASEIAKRWPANSPHAAGMTALKVADLLSVYLDNLDRHWSGQGRIAPTVYAANLVGSAFVAEVRESIAAKKAKGRRSA